MNARIIEQGNGFGGIAVGTVLVDLDGDVVTVVELSTRIHTDGCRGNYLLAKVEHGGELPADEQTVVVSYAPGWFEVQS